MPKFKNDERFLSIRNLLYKFCKVHDLKVKIIYDEQTRLMTFKIEDTQK